MNGATRIDAERLWQRAMQLATFTRPDLPWTRRAFGAEFVASRAWLADAFRAAGLQTRIDAAGNLIGRRPGRRDDLPALATGSHCDTVAEGGRFDGIIGVLAGLEIAHSMQDHQVQLDHPFEVIDFLSEEPSDYGVSCVGSRAMAGQLDASHLAKTNPAGETLAAAIDRIGGQSNALASVDRRGRRHAAFVELHIEQGPVLESRRLPIGVVSHIVGIRRFALEVRGRPDHAGTTPMDIRCDALAGAAELILRARRMAADHQQGPDYVVATVGRIVVSPNAANAVPGLAQLTLEVRSDNTEILAGFLPRLLADCEAALRDLRVAVDWQPLTESLPTACDGWIMDVIAEAASDLGLASMVMPSGAGHDAAYMAAAGPMGMIFVPCLNGRSHCPEEWLEPEQLADGTRALYQTFRKLDRALAAI